MAPDLRPILRMSGILVQFPPKRLIADHDGPLRSSSEGQKYRMRQVARALYEAIPFKRAAFEFIRNRLHLTPSFFRHLHFRGPFELRIDDRHSVKLFSEGNIVENELFWLGFANGWEATSLALWRRICMGGTGIILDIGANSGVYAVVAARLAPSAEVIAFEPIARVATQLRRNVQLNALPVSIEEKAVSDSDGTSVIYDLPSAFNYSASMEGQGPQARAVDVAVCSIDKFLEGNARAITAVKMDVERHEAAAISGMRSRLASDRPAMLIEILDPEIGNAVAEQIQDLDYLMFHIVEGKGIVAAPRLTPLSGHDWNHLLCTKEQFERFGLSDFVTALDGPPPRS